MIKLVNVSKYYNNANVTNLGLRNINLELNKGEIVAIVGESGSGKSTLLNVITKMDNFDEGEIYYKGNETSYFNVNDMDDFRKNKVGFIFQNYNIIDSYTVLDNVMMPYIINGIDTKEAKEKAINLIEKVGLKKRIHNRGTQLSGGEKQRCVIARALASNAEILACDEPTGNLDSKTGIEIINLIKEVAKDKLVLIVTHNFDSVKDIATRKIKIHDGEIVEDINLKDVNKADENVALDLDYVPIKKKIGIKIALMNLIKTPKRTILTTLIFMFVAIYAIILYQSIIYNKTNEEIYNRFIYKGDDKMLVYDVNHTPLDKVALDELKENKIITNYSINKFYANQKVYSNILIGDSTNYNKLYYYFGYESYPKDLNSSKDLTAGKMPSNDDEVIALLPSSAKDIDSSYILNKTIDLNEVLHEFNDKVIKIVGYQIRDDIESDTVVFTKNETLEKILNAYYLFYSSYNNSFYLTITNSTDTQEINHNLFKTIYDENLEHSYIKYYNSEYTIDKVYLNFNYENYNLINALELNSQPITSDEVEDYNLILYLGKDASSKLDQTIYEAFVYTNNIKFAQSKLDKLKYSYIQISKFSTTTALANFLNNLNAYFSIFISSFTILFVYFISYIVLARIYRTKRKDYTILRTLGITKKDMSFIVRMEVLLNTLAISIIVYLVAFIIGKTTTNSVLIIFKNIKPLTTFIYFAVMCIFAYFIARRFNKRLFKFSVNKTLKAEEVKND